MSSISPSLTVSRYLRFRMFLASVLLAGAAPFFLPTANAQMPLPMAVDAFGDSSIVAVERQNGAVYSPIQSYRGGPHVLIFHGGGRIQGEAISIFGGELAFRVNGIPEPLHLPVAALRSLIIVANISKNAFSGSQTQESGGGSASLRATVKLAGADWLFGELKSKDGNLFTLKTGIGPLIEIPRSEIEWVSFSDAPSPAYRLSGSVAEVAGWTGVPNGSSGLQRMQMVDGLLRLDEGCHLARTIPPSLKFKLTFEIPAKYEDGARLWMQPSPMGVNSYSSGTVEVEFGTKTVNYLLFQNSLQRETAVVPPVDGMPPEFTKYEICYDAVAGHYFIFRNGVQLAEVKNQSAESGATGVINTPWTGIRSICFDRMLGQARASFWLRDLVVEPWDGVLPGSHLDATPAGDRLNRREHAVQEGALGAISGNEIRYSGTSMLVEPDLFIRLNKAKALPEQMAFRAVFPTEGEISSSSLSLLDGVVTCNLPFGGTFESTLSSAESINFEAVARLPNAQEILLFKNGDELPGTLESISSSSSVVWKLPGGKSVEAPSNVVAGVRFDTKSAAGFAQQGPVVEMKNGDRLCGSAIRIEKGAMNLMLARFGELALDSSAVWRAYPNPRFSSRDGRVAPEIWTSAPLRKYNSAEDRHRRWTAFDGTYIDRTAGPGMQVGPGTLEALLENVFDRYECSFNVTSAAGTEPTFFLVLLTGDFDLRDGKHPTLPALLEITVNGNNLLLNPTLKQEGANPLPRNARLVEFGRNLSSRTSRLNVRAFVDGKRGTVDIFLDGMLCAQFGRETENPMPGIGYSLMVGSTGDRGYAPLIFSDIQITPWSGDFPWAGTLDPGVTLTNGDIIFGKVEQLKGATLSTSSDAGLIDVPLEKVQMIQCGGAQEPERVAARVRLADGTVLNLKSYRWENRMLVAHSDLLGDITLSPDILCELILNPAPMRPPHPLGAKKRRQKDAQIHQPKRGLYARKMSH